MDSYNPFQYPPNYDLARTHQRSSKPGKKTYLQRKNIDQSGIEQCPCCNKQKLYPYSQDNWRRRSIAQDFHEYGGAIVTYFWLLRFYAFIFGIVFLIYSAYLLTCIYQFCDLEYCQKFLGLWVISNENLFQLLEQKQENDTKIRLSLLRGFAYIILVVGNTMTLYVVTRFKKNYPPKKGLHNFTLIFKNVNNKGVHELNNQQSMISENQESSSVEIVRQLLNRYFKKTQIVQIFALSQLEPYHSQFNQKMRLFYQLKLISEDSIQADAKIKKQYLKLLENLKKLHKQSLKSIQKYNVYSDRVIVAFKSEITVLEVLHKFQMKGLQRIKYLMGMQSDKDCVYAQKCPMPDQINWNYIGHHQSQKIKLKVASLGLFIILVGICYGILSFAFKFIYVYKIPSPFGGILSFLSLFLLVVMALSFRQFMNRLSEMRYPNTQTSRTMFIVITTIVFHYIFYLALPTFYFWQAESHEKNKNLLIVTNQTITFIVFQVALASLNIMHLVWKKKQKKVENQLKPIGCQKILHSEIEYPHFPIEFKLIAIFKIFSFITFFAYQAPAIVFLTFFLLIFLYYRDKYAIYFHFKKQIIDSTIQFRFLKIYSCFFVIYSYIVFIITQSMEVEFWIGFGVAVCCIIAIFLIREPKGSEDECDKITDIKKLGLNDSYQARYRKFVDEAVCPEIEQEICEYLHSHQEFLTTKVQESQTGQPLL